jgi:hypothetical protein
MFALLEAQEFPCWEDTRILLERMNLSRNLSATASLPAALAANI